MTIGVEEPWINGLKVRLRVERIYEQLKTPYQSMLVVQTERYGRALFLDGLLQSAESDEALYHEAFVHPALVIQGAPRRVLVGGAGEGATLREILRHPGVEEIVAVDLDREVVDACRRHLPTWSDGAFEDPRVVLRYEDVQRTLSENQAPFDVILLDLTEPVEDGPAVDLFTVKFFRRVAEHMSDDSIMVLQSGELDRVGMKGTRTVYSTLREVFPWVRVLPLSIPSFHTMWCLTVAARRPMDPTPPDLKDRIDRLPADTLEFYCEGTHRALFEPPPWLSRGLARPGRVITGDDEARLAVVFGREEPPDRGSL